MSNCLNLRTVITYVTSHLEEGGFRIRRALQQSNQSLKSFPFHAGFFLPSHDGTSHNALPSYLPSIRNYSVSQKPPNRCLLISLCPELGHLDTPQCEGSLESKYLAKNTQNYTHVPLKMHSLLGNNVRKRTKNDCWVVNYAWFISRLPLMEPMQFVSLKLKWLGPYLIYELNITVKNKTI